MKKTVGKQLTKIQENRKQNVLAYVMGTKKMKDRAVPHCCGEG